MADNLITCPLPLIKAQKLKTQDNVISPWINPSSCISTNICSLPNHPCHAVTLRYLVKSTVWTAQCYFSQSLSTLKQFKIVSTQSHSSNPLWAPTSATVKPLLHLDPNSNHGCHSQASESARTMPFPSFNFAPLWNSPAHTIQIRLPIPIRKAALPPNQCLPRSASKRKATEDRGYTCHLLSQLAVHIDGRGW